MNPCKCGDYCRMMAFDDGENGQVYGIECNNPDCEHWNDEDYPPLAVIQAEAVRFWNEWVES